MTTVTSPTAELAPNLQVEFRRKAQALQMLPGVAVQALEIARDPECTIREFVAVVERDAKLAAEGLRRAGKTITRSGFVTAMDELRGYNLGGVTASFGHGAASASKFVELTLIGSQGRLIK